ncbi:L,D-transpeptidase [Nocardioides coralli]|uniref:L,D-transpeptidase n=1 Tax=Nocardioides coralli TaxID=2872154 RepID=UPI001CA38FBF|nr:L,D-transpeptidase [Nocardioides coralli]QZY30058.1 L,D-transpeptidase [Nocardioides coralli]
MGARRREVRPRYGRLTALASSVGITSVALLGGIGVLPSAAEPAADTPALSPAAAPAPAPRTTSARPVPSEVSVAAPLPRTTPRDLLPADSGEGRRVVFSEGQQRVWLVNREGRVRRTYLVSGSIHDNLDPGTYQVYSRSMTAIGIDDSGTMRYFVRFARGDTGAAIGFHDIPVDDGRPLQGVEELGTPTSHGCIRQQRKHARLMWDFAPLGTTVVVTA